MSNHAHKMFTDYEWNLLARMAERGWSSGDMAEYLEADEIAACMRILDTLGVSSRTGPAPSPAAARTQSRRRSAP